MAKRARGARRPGQRRASQRTGPRPAQRPVATSAATSAPLPVDGSSSEGLEEFEVRPASSPRGRTRSGPSAAFSESAAQEYAYVAADVRRIAVVGGGLFGLLIVLFVLIQVLGVVHF